MEKVHIPENLKIDLGGRVTVEPVPSGSLATLTGYRTGQGKVRRLKDNRQEANEYPLNVKPFKNILKIPLF